MFLQSEVLDLFLRDVVNFFLVCLDVLVYGSFRLFSYMFFTIKRMLHVILLGQPNLLHGASESPKA